MSKTLDQINEFMSKRPIGAPISRSELAKELAVSEKTIDRAMKLLAEDKASGLVVVFEPSLMRIDGAVCPDLDKCPESDKCPDLDKADGASDAKEPKRATRSYSPAPTSKAPVIPLLIPSAPLVETFELPPGYRAAVHKFQGRVVLDPKGAVDLIQTSRLKAAEAGVDPMLADALPVAGAVGAGGDDGEYDPQGDF